MGSWQTHANTIRSRYGFQVVDQIAGVLGFSLPTEYDNQGAAGFSKPDAAPWARATVLWGDSIQADIGTPSDHRYRTVGVLMVQVFVPLEEGDKRALQAAEFIDGKFRGYRTGGLQFRKPSISSAQREGSWWQVVVTCPFYVDDVLATAS